MIYCCKEHVEYALEEIVNESEMAPILKQVEADKLSTAICEYCGQVAEYVVAN
ncbi:CxxH/CxxC protein [Caldibacillus lycopersici]|uniref:CxxH/CxxC protein n=1 Tax=Perspicuibacillus lycopersici TaxID=1325689 RepID=A0AAE3IS38_9BACI|nr:CxxH/CxxC protein [Perspicuibacillus lycopersici]